MNKLVAAAVTAGAVAVSPAIAADMRPVPIPGPYVAVPAPGWTGAYAGLNLGYQLGKVDNLPLKPNGVLGGIQGGYNWQTGQFVRPRPICNCPAPTLPSRHTSSPIPGSVPCAAGPE